ncbi:hypothetical protein KC19_VG128800, partial [Ceratodon purpureus]
IHNKSATVEILVCVIVFYSTLQHWVGCGLDFVSASSVRWTASLPWLITQSTSWKKSSEVISISECFCRHLPIHALTEV